MEIPLALLADYANVAEHGKLNIMGIFDRIGARKFPHTHNTLFLVLRMVADPAEYESKKAIEIKLLDADGQQLLTLGSELEIGKAEGRPVEIPHMIRFNNLRFPQPGEYVFVALVNGDPKARIPVRVESVEVKTNGGEAD